MELRDAGDSCILDFSEISGFAFSALFRHDDKLGRRERRRIEKIIADMIDNYVTCNLLWTRWRHQNSVEEDRGRFGGLLRKHPNPNDLIHEIHDMIADLFCNVMEIPSWNIVFLNFSGATLEIELSEDYRIKDWMEKFGKKYGVTPARLI